MHTDVNACLSIEIIKKKEYNNGSILFQCLNHILQNRALEPGFSEDSLSLDGLFC